MANPSREAVLKAIWAHVIGDTWVDDHRESWPAGPPLRQLLEAGADVTALGQLVRTMQFEVLFSLLTELDGGTLGGHKVALFTIDDAGKAGERLRDLHESFLSADPTGQADDEAWA